MAQPACVEEKKLVRGARASSAAKNPGISHQSARMRRGWVCVGGHPERSGILRCAKNDKGRPFVLCARLFSLGHSERSEESRTRQCEAYSILNPRQRLGRNGAERFAIQNDTRLRSDIAGENRFELVRRDDLKLRVGAIARLLVGAPPSELRHVTEAGALHMLVRDFHNYLGPERLPR